MAAWHAGEVFERFTDRTRRVLVLAQEEARRLGHPFIGTEHLLLGLIGERTGVAARALASAGIDLERARQEVMRLVGATTASGGSPPFTPRAKKVLELSLRECLARGDKSIGTEHLLLGLVSLQEGIAASALVALGTSADDMRGRVEDILAGHDPGDVTSAAERRQARIHILEGLLRGMEHFTAVTEGVRGCPDRQSALDVLRAPPFDFSAIQAERVLDISVGTLVDEQRRRLAQELRQLRSESE